MSTTVTPHIAIGDRVETNDNLRGTCQYVGTVQGLGSVGLFVGIELDELISHGNDGSSNGIQYFACTNGRGIFVNIEDCRNVSLVETVRETSHGHNVNSAELNPTEASASLKSKFKRRRSQLEIERVMNTPNYFRDPMGAAQQMRFGHEMVGSSLEEWLPSRLHSHELESMNIVPPNYFEDPIAATKGKNIVKQMISSNLEDFHHRRPTLDELQMKNIYRSSAQREQRDTEVAQIKHELNDKLSHHKRPTITDLGDMHIIPHDYLDNLLEDAITHHTRKQSRMDHVQDRLQKHLPKPVAATLAETLVTSVDGHLGHLDSESSNDASEIIVNNPNSNDEEWQISFVYEPMQNFVPMNPAQKDEVSNKLERRLSLRPSKQQIEVWGFVPPQYFESPEQSFLRQALGREIALDLLEGFLPHREDIYNLTSRGIIPPDFVGRDHSEAVEHAHSRKKSVMDELNAKLDPHKRPSIVDLSDQGLIPENWLLDLYGLADKVRKRHQKMDSAVIDLKSQLNVPPVLADIVARDVLDEIETVDPYLDMDTHTSNNGYAQQIEQLTSRISDLHSENGLLQSEISAMKQSEHKHKNQILSLEKKSSLLQDQTLEISRLREEQNSTELHRLDSKAIEIELSKERSNTQRLRNDKSELENQLFVFQNKLDEMETIIQEFTHEKIDLVRKTNQQINELRNYIKQYQKYFEMQQKQPQKTKFNTFFFG